MATVNCTLSYVRTMDKGTNEGSATYHFGYGKAGQRWVTCYKVTIPSYTGTPSSITFNLSVNRGTAYPTNKDSTWKVGLDEAAPVWSAADGAYTAGSVYAKGYYYTYGAYTATFSGAISTSNVSKTVTFSTSSAFLDGGSTFYVYLYSGADAYNSIKLASISAYVTYSSEAVTGTTLYVGTTSTPTSTTAYPTPGKRTVYYRVTGLQNPVKNYYHFKVYLSNGFSMTARSDSGYNVSGTLLTTYSNSSSSAYEFTSSFSIPNTSFPIGSSTGIVVVASTTTYPNRYWRIGTRSDSTYLPVIRYIYPKAIDWFLNTVNCSAKVTGKNSVTYTFTHTTKNDPKYIKWLGAFTTSVPYSTTGHNGGSTGIWDYSCGSLNVSASAANTTYSFSQSGLSAGTTYTRYLQAGAQSETPYYASNYYYGLGSVSFTTDANYSGTNSYSSVGSSTATIQCVLNSTTNLDGYIYYSTSSGLSSKPSSKVAYSSKTGTVNLTSLTSSTSYKYYFYVYSSASGILYSVGNVSFTTNPASYTADISANVNGQNSITFNISNLNSSTNLNDKWYLTTDSASSTTNLWFLGSASRTNSITLLNFAPNSNNSYYAYVYNTVDKKYYQIGSITCSTDADYSGELLVNVTGTTSATIKINNLNSQTNLNNNIYITNNNVSPTTATISSGTLSNGANITGLTENTSYTYDAYVYSSASGTYYKIGNVSFKTEPESYTNIGKIAITGITTSDAYMCCFGMKNNTNMSNSYIMTFDNCGDNVNGITNPITEKIIGQSFLYTDLIGGMPYTVYFYVRNTRTDTYRLIGNVNFNAYSSVFYLGEKRVRAVKCDENGILQGCVIYLGDKLINAPQGGIILNSSDNYELISSDGYRLISY